MDCLIYPYHDWRKYEKEGPRGRDLHLIIEFQKRKSVNRILIINRPNSLSETLKNSVEKLPSYGEKIEGNNFYRLSKINEKIYVLDFFVYDVFSPILFRRKWWADIYISNKVAKVIQKVTDSYLENPVTLTFNPFSYKIIKNSSPKTLIYDIFDDFSDHPRLNKFERKTAKIGMDYLITASNKIIAVSNYFLRNIDVKKSKLISNGFSSHFLDINYKKTEISDIGGPIVGYSGRISKRLDIKLLCQLVEELPDATFVFLGEIYDKKWIEPLENYNNVRFLGAKNNSDLPSYFKDFGVGIVPHHVDEFEKAGHSIKVFEYLSCGIPVVSTNIGEVTSEENIIDVCQEQKVFVNSVKKFIYNKNNKSPKLIDKRKSFVKENTWERKVDSYISFIQHK